MSLDRAFRILIAHDAEKSDFVARVPELEIEVRGPTRGDALSEAENAIEQRVAAAAEDKQPLPEPVDVQPVGSGEVTLTLAGPLYRDLLFHARAGGVNPDAFALQLLARALGGLEGLRPGRRRPGPDTRAEGANGNERAPARDDRDDRDRDRGRSGDRGRGRGRPREGYRPELDDKANFLEYLRGLEKGAPGRGRR